MPSIREMRAIRRHNLSQLMGLYGQAELSKDSGIAEAYLYQMGKAEGKQARGINDDNARTIEAAAGVDRHWLDVDRRSEAPRSIEAELKAARIRRRHAWPFKTIERERYDALEDGDKLRVEGAALKALAAIEREREQSGKRKAG